MKALFIHDHIFYSDGKNYYSDKLPYKTWQRYLLHFDEITIFGRQKIDINASNKLPLSSGERVNFVIGSNISNFKSFFKDRSLEKKRIEDLIKNTDFLIARNSLYGNMSIKIARKLNKPYLLEIVGCPFDALWYYGSLKGKCLAPIAKYNLKNIVNRTKYIHYVSNKFLQDKYPYNENCITAEISNVELPDIIEEVLDNRIKKIKTNKKRITFGLIGSYSSKYKGIHIAIKSLHLLCKSNPNFEFQLRIVGSGDPEYYENLIKKLSLEKNVFFDGIICGVEKVFEWLDNIDIYLQPSLTEGLPRALIEAMSRGCPCVGSDVGGIPELLDRKVLFKRGDYSELFEILSNLIFDISFLEEQANRNFNNSKNYHKVLLDKKREDLFNLIKKDLSNEKTN